MMVSLKTLVSAILALFATGLAGQYCPGSQTPWQELYRSTV
jgi:hypothetical protein